MKNFKDYIAKDKIIAIDYESGDVPQSVRILKPTLYKEDAHSYCCILGKDLKEGIFGCGSTMQEAMQSWDKAFGELQMKEEEVKVKYAITQKLETNWRFWQTGNGN